MLECVVNVSEGRRPAVIDALVGAAGRGLLDLHCDEYHHRCVLTVAGSTTEMAVREVAIQAVKLIDLRRHRGAHPRIGVLDVVPFVTLDADVDLAMAARDDFARWASQGLGLPCFLYGPERSLPEVRRGAFSTLAPDMGPTRPHPTAGAVAVGARPPLVAYNLWLAGRDVGMAREMAALLRSTFSAGDGSGVRALGLDVGGVAQVSCNLLDPTRVGPDQVYDAVAARTAIARAELVGLVPAAVLAGIPEARWDQLDLGAERTIEGRLACL
ncbi:MAG: glutamate formiminotransferase [Acidimicrobiales bacterium]|nr:MAG: glutamate formiminotransferase [Acidimicrobiales bacterium]